LAPQFWLHRYGIISFQETNTKYKVVLSFSAPGFGTHHKLSESLKMADQLETTDVLICGCGPTGAMLSAYLGQMNIPNIVLEKEPGITTDPRGIALDDDGIRLVQGLGLYDHVFTEIGSSKYHICRDPWRGICSLIPEWLQACPKFTLSVERITG
jgi:cation diffusion facilitator CzcD-associated flavoprotein CzcO